MGYSKDLGTSKVSKIDPVTGYPMDEYGHLLNPISHHDGAVASDWEKLGTELYNFTNPYGFLHYAIGDGDDFWCFDLNKIDAGPRGQFIILDATINSETGSFIMGGGYEVIPCNTEAQKLEAFRHAHALVDDAITWTVENEVRHTRRGWNQDEYYFLRQVAQELFPYEFKKWRADAYVDAFSSREFRFGGKRINRVMDELYKKLWPVPAPDDQKATKRHKK